MTDVLAVMSEMVEDRPSLVLATEAAYVTETATGLIFADETPIEVWGALTERLIVQRRRIDFALADALNFGRRYGERYAQWVEETGLRETTLANVAWVGRKVDPSRRRDDVDFTYYQAVAPLPPQEQDRYIELAVEQGLTRYELRQAIKSDRESAIPLRASAERSEPVCAADRWQPTKDDLLPEHRAALERAAFDADLADPAGFTAGWLAALVYAGEESMFKPEAWRD